MRPSKVSGMFCGVRRALFSSVTSVKVGCLAVGLAALAIRPGAAAERLVLKVGPLQQSIELSDLESFARTGDVPPSLRLYQGLLSPQIQLSLQQRLALDPRMSDRVIDDVLSSSNGELLLATLSRIAPNLTMPQLQSAIRLAASQANGLSILGILRAVPQETLELDLSAAIGLISQLNLSNLESRSLSGVLEQSLAVESAESFPRGLKPAEAGPVGIRQRTISFRDIERDRIIPVEVYWSAESQSADGPLVVLSHGFGADRYFLNYQATHLASHGFTVVSVEHPGSNVQALLNLPVDPEIVETPSRLLPATEFLDRPRDVSFVLDRLERLNRVNDDYLGAFNTENVTIIGHSLGGYTGLALAGAKLDLRSLQNFCKDIQPLGVSPADWLQCAAMDLNEQQADLQDGRIRQVMAMNPLVGELFGEAGLTNITAPTLLLTGTKDSVTPTLDQQLTPFSQLSGPKYLLAVIGGTHLSVGDPTNVNPALSELPFMAELRGEDTANLRELLKGVSLSFVQQSTPAAKQYRPFLSAAYAQSFSTPLLPLRFTEALPSSVNSWLSVNSGLSESAQPTLTNRLVSVGYLTVLKSQHQWHATLAAHFHASQVVTMLRSPLSPLASR
ncbi:MAG: alpha/beta fold hydrolase [Cyanobacteria bacterium J06597_16]